MDICSYVYVTGVCYYIITVTKFIQGIIDALCARHEKLKVFWTVTIFMFQRYDQLVID